jgi:spartin
VALSAAMIFASLAASTVRLADAGGTAVTAAVAHRYGAAAGENAALATGTVRNVVLVYVDVRGLARKAIVKRVAKSLAPKGHGASEGPRARVSSPTTPMPTPTPKK